MLEYEKAKEYMNKAIEIQEKIFEGGDGRTDTLG